jgi:hypothetical protein
MSDMPEKPKRGQSSGFMDAPQSRIIAALTLIGLGVLFLLQQNNLVSSDFAWWSFFIIVPGVALLASGIMSYSRAGFLTPQARGQITGGTMATIVGAIFLFNLDWGKVWPVFLIVPGIFMLLGFNRSDSEA